MITEFISSAAESIDSNISKIENISEAVYSGDNLPVSHGLQFQLFQDALESEFNSPSELEAKKLMSAALLIAKNKGLLPEGISNKIGAEDVAILVDDTFTIMKAAYQIATGKIDVYEGADIIIIVPLHALWRSQI